MDLDGAIGKLIIAGFRGSSLDDPETRADIADFKRARIGGVLLFDQDLATGTWRNIRSPEQLTKLIADLRHELGQSLIVAIDQEGGQVSRLSAQCGFLDSCSAHDFAAMPADQQQAYAIKHANQLADLGIDLNFAPCVDLAINPDSAIIAGKQRAFGSDAEQVIACARTIIEAHRYAGVRWCIKHFPGHGSATGDTHNGQVDITETHQRDELQAYKELLAQYGQSAAVMTGHLMHRGYDTEHPASMSQAITTGWLGKELGHTGVVITDSLDMGGASGQGAAARAINAGADIALNGNNTANGFQPDLGMHMHRQIRAGVEPDRIFESAHRVGNWTR